MGKGMETGKGFLCTGSMGERLLGGKGVEFL